MMRACKSLAVLVSLAGVLAAAAGELGQKAPKLQIAEWIKGGPVDITKTDGKKIYVVEFWATWCPPCRESIPHLTAMQRKYKDKVTFIGVSDEKPEVVRRFVSKMGDKMDYVVAVDKNKQTGKAYMGEFGIRGIPHAFIIGPDGTILWHDHPMANIDEVIDRILAGKFDLAAAKELRKQRQRQEQQMREMFTWLQRYFELASREGNDKEVAELGRKILERGKDNAEILNEFAWAILTEKNLVHRDLQLALRAAETANRLTEGKDASTLDTYAMALFQNGQKKKAIEVQQRAVELARKDDRYARLVKDLEKRLEQFRKQSKP